MFESSGDAHFEELFNELPVLVDVEVIINNNFGKSICVLAKMIFGAIEPFTSGSATCSVDKQDVARAIGELESYLDGGFKQTMTSVDLPVYIEERLEETLAKGLHTITEEIETLMEIYEQGEIMDFFLQFFSK